MSVHERARGSSDAYLIQETVTRPESAATGYCNTKSSLVRQETKLHEPQFGPNVAPPVLAAVAMLVSGVVLLAQGLLCRGWRARSTFVREKTFARVMGVRRSMDGKFQFYPSLNIIN